MPGLLRGVARTAVVAGTAAHVAGNVHHRQERRWAEKDASSQQQDDQQPQYEPQNDQAPSSVTTDDEIEQLEKLGELKDKGILTQSEFDTKKRQILGL